MENTPVADEVVVSKKNVLFEVTTLSKTLAAILFIILPFVGFWVGTIHTQNLNNHNQTVVTQTIKNQAQEIQKEVTGVEAVKVTKMFDLTENDYWVSAQTGIFKGYLSKKTLGKDEVLGPLLEGETITCDTFTITEGDLSIFYKYAGEDKYVSLTENELPYEIYIGDGDVKNLAEITQDVLLKSTPTSTVLVAITEYINKGDIGLYTCESEVELFIAI